MIKKYLVLISAVVMCSSAFAATLEEQRAEATQRLYEIRDANFRSTDKFSRAALDAFNTAIRVEADANLAEIVVLTEEIINS